MREGAPHLPVYRWPDGTLAELTSDPGLLEEFRLPVLVVHHPPVEDFYFVIYRTSLGLAGPNGLSLLVERLSQHPELERKLLGLCLDLGHRRFEPHVSTEQGLVKPRGRPSQGTFPRQPLSCVRCPRWVPDDRWDQRYAEARTGDFFGTSLLESGFLSSVKDLRLEQHSKTWSANWETSDDLVQSGGFESLEGIVDHVLEHELVLPERLRASWEAEHAVRGTFLLPTEEDAALLRTLGEENPLLWPTNALWEWLVENAAPRRGLASA